MAEWVRKYWYFLRFDLKMTLPCKGVMRLRYKYEELMVLRMPYYEPLLHLLEKQDYAVLVILGRVSGEREDAARSLVCVSGCYQVIQTSRAFDAGGPLG